MQPVNLTVTIVPTETDEPSAVGYGFKLVDTTGAQPDQFFYGNGADPIISTQTTVAEGVYSVFVFTYDVNKSVVGALIATDTPTIEVKAPVIVRVAVKTIASASIVVA